MDLYVVAQADLCVHYLGLFDMVYSRDSVEAL